MLSAQAARLMQSKSDKPLPKTTEQELLPGAVCAQYVRCGRSNCRCASGVPTDWHGPYFYRFWRSGGRVHKQYVKRADVEAVRRRCAAGAQERAIIAQFNRLHRASCSSYNSLLRQLKEERGVR